MDPPIYFLFFFLFSEVVSHTHHHAGGDGDPSPAVGVGDDISVPHTEEGDGYQPHGVEEVGVLLVMVPASCHI